MTKGRSEKGNFPNVDTFLNFLRERNPGRSIRQKNIPAYKQTEISWTPFPVEVKQREVLMDGQRIGVIDYFQGTQSGVPVHFTQKYPQLVDVLKEYQIIRFRGMLPTGDNTRPIDLTYNFYDGRRSDRNEVPFP